MKMSRPVVNVEPNFNKLGKGSIIAVNVVEYFATLVAQSMIQTGTHYESVMVVYEVKHLER